MSYSPDGLGPDEAVTLLLTFSKPRKGSVSYVPRVMVAG
jgi:hypothetical protein